VIHQESPFSLYSVYRGNAHSVIDSSAPYQRSMVASGALWSKPTLLVLIRQQQVYQYYVCRRGKHRNRYQQSTITDRLALPSTITQSDVVLVTWLTGSSSYQPETNSYLLHCNTVWSTCSRDDHWLRTTCVLTNAATECHQSLLPVMRWIFMSDGRTALIGWCERAPATSAANYNQYHSVTSIHHQPTISITSSSH